MSAIVEAVAVFPSKAHGSIPVLREVHVVQSWLFCVIFIRVGNSKYDFLNKGYLYLE
jgi:hypothetical protein